MGGFSFCRAVVSAPTLCSYVAVSLCRGSSCVRSCRAASRPVGVPRLFLRLLRRPPLGPRQMVYRCRNLGSSRGWRQGRPSAHLAGGLFPEVENSLETTFKIQPFRLEKGTARKAVFFFVPFHPTRPPGLLSRSLLRPFMPCGSLSVFVVACVPVRCYARQEPRQMLAWTFILRGLQICSLMKRAAFRFTQKRNFPARRGKIRGV